MHEYFITFADADGFLSDATFVSVDLDTRYYELEYEALQLAADKVGFFYACAYVQGVSSPVLVHKYELVNDKWRFRNLLFQAEFDAIPALARA